MTVIWAEVVPEGIIFGADKHRSHTMPGASIPHLYEVVTKIFKTNNGRVLVGAAGLGKIAGKDKSEWLKERIEPMQDEPVSKIAAYIHGEIVNAYNAEFRGRKPVPLIVDISGYRFADGVWIPAMHYISNAWSIVNGSLADFRHEFGQFPDIIADERFAGTADKDMPMRISKMATEGSPVWIYHTPLLGEFRPKAEKVLNEWMSQNGTPTAIQDWEHQVLDTIIKWSEHVKNESGTEIVGGGVDVLSIVPP